jgi:molybdopterin converting factor small subunit
MTIRVEFYGIARQRAGIGEIGLEWATGELTLADVFSELTCRLPQLGTELLVNGRLHESLTANLDGTRFVSDPATLIGDGQSLLILSADAGG